MQEVPQELKTLLFGRGARWHAQVACVFVVLGLGCFLVGIIGDAVDRVPGLQLIHWFVMTPILFVMGLWAWLTAYYAAKEGQISPPAPPKRAPRKRKKS